jgi:hypothetical protein
MSNNIFAPTEEKEFQYGYWYVTHKVLIRQIAILILMIVSSSLFLTGLVGLVKYYFADAAKNAALVQALAEPQISFANIAALGTPQPLSVAGSMVFSGADNSYDFLAEVDNINEVWYAKSFDYYFTYGAGLKTEPRKGFALPGQHKYLLDLGIPLDTRIADAEVVIENVDWEKAPDFKSLEDKILQFQFPTKTLTTLSTPATTAAPGTTGVMALKVEVVNPGSYSFWAPRFDVLFYRSNTLVGITELTLSQISTGEKQTANMNIFQKLPAGVRVEVVPDIDILNPDVFKGFGDGSGELK